MQTEVYQCCNEISPLATSEIFTQRIIWRIGGGSLHSGLLIIVSGKCALVHLLSLSLSSNCYLSVLHSLYKNSKKQKHWWSSFKTSLNFASGKYSSFHLSSSGCDWNIGCNVSFIWAIYVPRTLRKASPVFSSTLCWWRVFGLDCTYTCSWLRGTKLLLVTSFCLIGMSNV